MNITINGKNFNVNENSSLYDILEKNHLNSSNIVIEINQEIISKNLWGETKVNKNDKIEIITAVGGG
ncbi:MAG: sulfur carrier protein ThiS [Gammaproteobacteria bacterium]|jgi:sulfur carrier protein